MIMMNHMEILNVMMITYSDAVDKDDDDDAVMKVSLRVRLLSEDSCCHEKQKRLVKPHLKAVTF